jgi:hypothetical protein
LASIALNAGAASMFEEKTDNEAKTSAEIMIDFIFLVLFFY